MDHHVPLRIVAINQFRTLSPGEELFTERAEQQSLVDCENKTIRAEFIRWLLNCRETALRFVPAGLVVSNASITGRTNTSSTTIPFPLCFLDCSFEQGVNLSFAEVGGNLGFEGARMSELPLCSFEATGLRVRGDLILNRAKLCGTVELSGADLQGSLRLAKAQLNKLSDRVLVAEGAKIGGSVDFDSLESCGQINLRGMSVGGALRCRGAKLLNKDLEGRLARTLDGSGMRVAGPVLFDEQFVSEGEIRIVGAVIGGNLRLANGELRGTPNCFVGDLIRIEGNIICSAFVGSSSTTSTFSASHGLRAFGEMRLIGARIRGNADFNASSFCSPGGCTSSKWSRDRGNPGNRARLSSVWASIHSRSKGAAQPSVHRSEIH